MPRLDQLCNIQYGYAFNADLFTTKSSQGVPLVRIRDVVRGYTETYTPESFSEAYRVHDGDILIGMDGEFNVARWHGGDAALNQRVCKITPRNNIHSQYLFYFLPQALKRIEDQTPFVTVKHLSAKKLSAIEVPDISMMEQANIAERLDIITTLLANRRQVDEKLAELPKARFVEMFGDPVVNPMGWEKHRLDELGTCKNGMNFHNGDSGVELHCLGVGDFKNHSVITDCQILPKVSLNQIPSQDYLLKDDDIVFVRSNGNKDLVGRCLAVYPKNTPTTFSGFCIRFRADERSPITTEYLLSVLKTSGIRSMMAGRGANIQNLNQKMLSALPIPLPPLDLQRRFAAFARACAAQRAACARQIAVLETLRGKLLQDAFGAAG